MTSALTVSYHLRVPDTTAAPVPAQDTLTFDLAQSNNNNKNNNLSELSSSIRAARASMNGILTTWKESVNEKEAEEAAEQKWMAVKEAEERSKFEEGVADEDDQEERVRAEEQA